MATCQFIPDQQLFTLQLNSRQRDITRQYLTQNCLPDQYSAAAEVRDANELDRSRQSQWVPVENRLQFLINAGIKPQSGTSARGQRLCITALAGGGKSKCLEQLVFVRQQRCPGQLVADFHISKLPNASSDWENCLVQLVLHKLNLPPSAASVPHHTLPSESQLKHWIADLAESGKLTLAIDGLDEIGVSDGRAKMQALREFLDLHPRTHCVVAGRPYAVYEDYWWTLLAPTPESEASDWQFCVAEVFSQEQRERFLGLKVLNKLARLQAGLQLNPRTLEVLRTLDENELESLRTLADIYWHSNYKAVCLDRKNNPELRQTKLKPQEILSILGAVAFQAIRGVPEDTAAGFFEDDRSGTGKNVPDTDTQRQAATTLPLTQSVWDELLPRIAAAINDPGLSRKQAEDLLNELHKLGSQYIEFAYITIDDKQTLKWRVTTQRDFLAALYLLRHGSHDDINWLKTHQSCVLTWQTAQSRHAELLELWRFVCGMPDAAFADFEHGSERWAALAQALYRCPTDHARATELMALALPRLLQRAGILTKPAWNDQDLQQAIQQAQSDATIPHAPSTNRYRQIVNQFFGEYPQFRNGIHRQLCKEDLERHWKHCDSAAGKRFRTGHPEESNNPVQDRHLEVAFEISAVPVTRRLYALFDPRHAAQFADYNRYSPSGRCPAIYLTFWDSWMLSVWLHGRLPSEWEWEYAARGPQDLSSDEQPIWWWGDDWSELGKHAWFEVNSRGHAHEVGTRKPNPYGLYDKLGNVWEWTSSLYAPEDPIRVGRVLRGGSFRSGAIHARCSCRDGGGPSGSTHSVGCRLARAAIRKP